MGVSSEESLHNVATLHSLFMYAISCTFIYLSTSTIFLKEKKNKCWRCALPRVCKSDGACRRVAVIREASEYEVHLRLFCDHSCYNKCFKLWLKCVKASWWWRSTESTKAMGPAIELQLFAKWANMGHSRGDSMRCFKLQLKKAFEIIYFYRIYTEVADPARGQGEHVPPSAIQKLGFLLVQGWYHLNVLFISEIVRAIDLLIV